MSAEKRAREGGREERPLDVEIEWQRRWDEAGVFRADRPGSRPKRYVLEMLPYPSGRLHVGHVRNYTMGDVVARFLRMRGFAVMHPLGWDSLGLPAETAALQHGSDPRSWTTANIATMRAQLRRLGFSYDWSREIASHEPDYYRWNQWFFLKFLEHDLAYRKLRAVHWCEQCRTVLANEQVEDGRCYRCERPVEVRELEQWFFRTTRFQEELLAGLDELTGWPEALRTTQRNWIGRSEGARVTFPVEGRDAAIEVFTTRLDTIHGCTFVVIAPDHPVLERLGLEPEVRSRLQAFAHDVARAHVSERGEQEKEGVPTGTFARNPFTGRPVPIWAANFVVKDYGTGAVMSVPAHDLRDLEFARKYDLPIAPVVGPTHGGPQVEFTEDGVLTVPGPFDGLASADAREALLRDGSSRGIARPEVVFRLRDWGLSRQRYWGTPIPIIHCPACGIVPVPYSELPVLLPDHVELTGEASPLARHEAFARVKCPKCGGDARRESDTMDTFVDSSWYFFRYLDPRATDRPFSEQAVRDWMPVDLYIGGPEHAVGHLIYMRWWARAMREIGLDVPAEPVKALVHHGMVTLQTQSCPVHGWRYPEEVEDGRCRECRSPIELGDHVKMSKSKRNVVEPDDYVQRYGADTLRLFSMFAAPAGKELEWSDAAVEGLHRFLGRAWRLATREGLAAVDPEAPATTPEGEALEDALHRTIHRVTVDVEERLHFNTAIAALMELTNAAMAAAPPDKPLPKDAGPLRRTVEGLLKMLAPFAPHACEEAWSRLGRRTLLAAESWPAADPARLVEDTCVVAVQVGGKLRGEVQVRRDATADEVLAAARPLERVARHVEGMEIVKLVHVPNRLLNVVVRPARAAS